MSVRDLNASFAGAPLRPVPIDRDFAAYDALPKDLRRRIAENTTKLDCEGWLAHAGWSVQRCGSGAMSVARLDEIERNEIAVFAGQYRARCGFEYPHVAAQASIQRW